MYIRSRCAVVSSTPRPHFFPGKDPVPILQEAGWAPGPVWTGGKSRPHRDSITDRPAHSQSLYRLSYSAHIYIYICVCVCVCVEGEGEGVVQSEHNYLSVYSYCYTKSRFRLYYINLTVHIPVLSYDNVIIDFCNINWKGRTQLVPRMGCFTHRSICFCECK